MKAEDIEIGRDYVYHVPGTGTVVDQPSRIRIIAKPAHRKVRARFLHPDPHVADWDGLVPTRSVIRLWDDAAAALEQRAWERCLYLRSIADRMTALGLIRSLPHHYGKGGTARGQTSPYMNPLILTIEEIEELLELAEAGLQKDKS